MPMLHRVGRCIVRVLLGGFVLWQFLFLVGLNLCEVIRQAGPSFPALVERFPSVADSESPPRRRLARAEQVFTRWSELTGQTQNWSLFAPNVWANIPFAAVELRWDDEPADAPASAAGLVAALAGNCPLQTATAWTAAAPRPPVHLLSDNEPRDIQHYFRVGWFRLRRYESSFDINFENVDVEAANEEDNREEAMHLQWRQSIFNKVRSEPRTIRAYLEWMWRTYLADHPGTETPRQVILSIRTYRIPLPGQQPWIWDGPEEQPVARWRPHFKYLTGAPPVEAYDLVAERYDVLP